MITVNIMRSQSRRPLKKWLRSYRNALIRAITTTRDIVAADNYIATFKKANGMTVLEEIQQRLDEVKR